MAKILRTKMARARFVLLTIAGLSLLAAAIVNPRGLGLAIAFLLGLGLVVLLAAKVGESLVSWINRGED